MDEIVPPLWMSLWKRVQWQTLSDSLRRWIHICRVSQFETKLMIGEGYEVCSAKQHHHLNSFCQDRVL